MTPVASSTRYGGGGDARGLLDAVRRRRGDARGLLDAERLRRGGRGRRDRRRDAGNGVWLRHHRSRVGPRRGRLRRLDEVAGLDDGALDDDRREAAARGGWCRDRLGDRRGQFLRVGRGSARGGGTGALLGVLGLVGEGTAARQRLGRLLGGQRRRRGAEGPGRLLRPAHRNGLGRVPVVGTERPGRVLRHRLVERSTARERLSTPGEPGRRGGALPVAVRLVQWGRSPRGAPRRRLEEGPGRGRSRRGRATVRRSDPAAAVEGVRLVRPSAQIADPAGQAVRSGLRDGSRPDGGAAVGGRGEVTATAEEAVEGGAVRLAGTGTAGRLTAGTLGGLTVGRLRTP
ncbi:hypothetical protein GA0070611_4930 [Micromonospora auratinigra]|uniref:Uncharacterized protein n=1 Tax=Micromonospora auratinigra TaxID=261654 RepID=A0A1A9A3W7_9ACTN|nr:hypothetical protein GA0070611_4930 [Micromonospora auratinigra]